MSENEEEVLRKLYGSVEALKALVDSLSKNVEFSFIAVNKRVDTIEQKIDESKRRVIDKYIFPVLATVTAAIIFYCFSNFTTRMIQAMDTIARQGVIKP